VFFYYYKYILLYGSYELLKENYRYIWKFEIISVIIVYKLNNLNEIKENNQ